MMFVMSPVAFGQINLTIQTNSSPQEINTNRTAYSADPDSSAALTVIASVASTSIGISATTLIIDYPAIITTGRASGSGSTTATFLGQAVPGVTAANTNYGTAATAGTNEATPITLAITSASGVFGGASAPIITTVNYSTGQVYIMLPFNGCTTCAQFAVPAGGQTGGSFRLENVRLDVNGVTAPAVASFSLASTASGYQIVSATSGNVIDALSAGIATVDTGSTPNTGVVNIGVTTPADNTFTLRVQEGFARAWYNDGLGDFFDNTNNRDTELRLTFTGIPAGVTITLSGSIADGGAPSFSPTTITQSDNVSTVTWTTTGGQLSRSVQQRLTVTGTIGSLTTSAANALTAGSITVTVSMAPVGSGNIAATTSTGMLPDTTLSIPRFAASEVGPVTVATITAAKSTLLIPYAVSIPSIRYDTGIAVSNTSKDPFGTNGGATASAGTLIFHFFPRTATGAGTQTTYTTSATNQAGDGIDASGVVPAGGTWSGLLSELWPASGGTGDFVGYIFIEANFLLGHGVAYVSTFAGDFTSATPVLELDAPAITTRGGGTDNVSFAY
jgi:hypothetical protein